MKLMFTFESDDTSEGLVFQSCINEVAAQTFNCCSDARLVLLTSISCIHRGQLRYTYIASNRPNLLFDVRASN
jgi:hypothetical protein